MSKSKATALVAGVALFLGLVIWGSPERIEVIPRPDVREKAMPSYALDVEPILQGSCVQCHQGPAAAAAFDVSNYEGLLRGTAFGPMVIPGNSAASNLVAHLKKDVSSKLWQKCLSPGQEPSPNQIKNLERWVREGARNN
ncbi:MAG: hypothetical protein HY671_13805 [Chloroflexi bacterium]|nr:hypothetical protein [Chloroflexota bacterium]